jgi:transposase-like protein
MSELDGKDVASTREGGGAYGVDGRGAGPDRVGGNGKRPLAPVAGEASKIPDPEVEARPKRRRFSAAYKARIVAEAEGCTESGDIGALLRREGLYSSQLSKWREQYRAGALDALRDDKRGRKRTRNPLEDEVVRLRKENARLSGRLEQAEAIIEIQKKVAAMLGNPLPSVEPGAGD